MDELEISEVALAQLEDGLVVGPVGPIRSTASERFREHVDRLLKAGAATWLVIDFSRVDYIDSATAGYLLNVHDRLKNKGGGLALAALTPGVRIVIDSIGLTTFFAVCETVDEAALELGS